MRVVLKTRRMMAVMALMMLSGIAAAYSIVTPHDSIAATHDSVAPLRCDTVTATPLTRNSDRPYAITNGLDGRHIAVWGSHGLYYELGNARWEWQRARMFNTIEDKLPSDYVINYLTPMLERAGAVVLMPRERDANTDMVIVDGPLRLPQGGEVKTYKNHGTYEEHNGQCVWQTGQDAGFAYVKEMYKGDDNPFIDGTYRMTSSVTNERDASTVTWIPEIKKDGRYAVYVAYKSFGNSATDARYTVYHKGGKTTVLVNQQMGGGTWVYIGTFGMAPSNSPMGKGNVCKVVLSNVSAAEGAIVTADAVRFGGGMGNIARKADGSRIYDNTKEKKDKAGSRPRNEYQPVIDTDWEVSGYPRYCEGARYYMQWAGIPSSVYSLSGGTNDYVDDYKSRSKWVNYMAGGSARYPDADGLRIPIDLSFAFHTDGGSVGGNNIIGTLAIYKTAENGGRLGDGSSRSACRDLTQTVYNSILGDIRRQVEPRWSGRGCVDKGYAEAAALVPSMLLELLSHESFGEMRYGNDPRFKFIVSRAIYKGMLRFMSKRYGYDYVVQPLPVSSMAVRFTGSSKVEVSWKAVADSLEPSALAERYVVYKRIGDGDFDNGTLCKDTIYSCEIPEGKVVSFKVTAVNNGGESMDSEIVSAGIGNKGDGIGNKGDGIGNKGDGIGNKGDGIRSKGDGIRSKGDGIRNKGDGIRNKVVLVINGFDRVSAPDDFMTSDDKLAGFLDDEDGGVADGCDISYVGRQKEFRRSVKMDDDDSPGFGACYADYERQLVAGNTHDYAAVHGESILKAGMSFVSVSRDAVRDLLPLTTDSVRSLDMMYSAIDVILGKEKQTRLGRGVTALQYKTFDDDMQKLLTDYCRAGGCVFVSGAYIATDLWHNPLAKSLDSDRRFAQNILKYKWRDGKAATQGKVRYIASPLTMTNGQRSMTREHDPVSNGHISAGKEIDYWNTVNSTSYVVESPDAIIPADNSAVTAMRYSENGLGAAIVFGGNSKDHWRTVVMAFPFEAVKEPKDRDMLMQSVLGYLLK